MTTYTRHELETMFSECIDEGTQPFVFFGTEYPASKVLKEVDPILWREEFLNWMSAEDITELTNPEAPDVELYAYVRDIEDEYENGKLSDVAMAEEYEEQRGDELYDWRNDDF